METIRPRVGAGLSQILKPMRRRPIRQRPDYDSGQRDGAPRTSAALDSACSKSFGLAESGYLLRMDTSFGFLRAQRTLSAETTGKR